MIGMIARSEVAAKMQVTGLDHVQLAMPAGREAEACAFYGGLLSMTELSKPEPLASRGGCWFEAPGTVVHIGVGEPLVPQRNAHPAFLVSELEQARRDLRAAGAPVVADGSVPGLRPFYTADSFGNRIQILEAADGFLGKISFVRHGRAATEMATMAPNTPTTTPAKATIPIDVETTVRVLLQTQGLAVSDEEFARFVKMYPAMREGADRLYIPESRYEEPAPLFTPDWE